MLINELITEHTKVSQVQTQNNFTQQQNFFQTNNITNNNYISSFIKEFKYATKKYFSISYNKYGVGLFLLCCILDEINLLLCCFNLLPIVFIYNCIELVIEITSVVAAAMCSIGYLCLLI